MNYTGGDGVTSTANHSAVTNQTEVDSSNNCEQVGFLLNGFVIRFYFCGAQPQTPSSIVVYLKNLVVADFLLCLCLPIRIVNFATNSVTIRLIHCNLSTAVLSLNMYASIVFMAYIAANRYLKIVYGTVRTHILQTVRVARIVSIVTWVFLLGPMSTYIITSYLTQKPLTSVPVSCEVLHSGRFPLIYKIIHIFCTTIFLFILLSMVFFYYSTSRKVSLAQQRQPASSSSKKLEKSHRNILVLVCVFCFCFVPYHLVSVPKAFLWSYCYWRKIVYYLMELTILMSVLNVCLDPLIYFIFCKSLRAQFRWRAPAGN